MRVMESNKRAEFDAIYEAFHKGVYYTAWCYTGSSHTAEDITQEVFLKYYLYTRISTVDSPKAWLMTLSRNLSLNHKRKLKHETLLDMEEHEAEFADESSNPENMFFEKLWKSDALICSSTILEALKSKKQRWYDAVTYVYCMGRTRREVAEIMGISEDALDGILKRAKNWIEKNYRKEHDHINQK